MEKESKLYEIGYLLSPNVLEEAVLGETNLLRDAIEKNSGVVSSEEKAKLQKLAYTIKKPRIGKFETAYFGWIKFLAEPENVVKIKSEIDKNGNVLRFMIINGSDEVVVPRAPRKTYTKKEEDTTAEKPQIKNEEVDKKIEELIGA